MKLKRMMKLFLDYKYVLHLLERIEKDLEYFNNQKEITNKRRYDKTIQVNEKWTRRKQEILDKWKDITDENIESFVNNHQNEIEEYYNNSKRKNEYNPFKKYYT